MGGKRDMGWGEYGGGGNGNNCTWTTTKKFEKNGQGRKSEGKETGTEINDLEQKEEINL